jgi:hypothetical protein
MRPTAEEKQKVRSDLDEAQKAVQELKKQNQKFIEERLRLGDTEERQKWYMREIERLQAARNTKDPHGNASTDLDDLIKEAHQMVGQDVKTFDSWQSAMQALLGLLLGAVSVYNNRVTSIALQIGKTTEPFGLRAAKNFLGDKIKKSEVEETKFVYQVSMNDGVLTTSIQTNLDKYINGINPKQLHGKGAELYQETTEAQRKAGLALDLAAEVWLKSVGYEPDPTMDGKYVDEHGVELTDEEFLRLKQDENVGLDKFIRESADFDVRPKVTPSPRP